MRSAGRVAALRKIPHFFATRRIPRGDDRKYRSFRPHTWMVACIALACCAASHDDPEARLTMSKPVACSKINGHNDYVELGEAIVSLDEKLLVYTNVTGYTVRQEKQKHRVHLVEDVNLRKKGEKRVIWGRKKLLDFVGESDTPPAHVFLGTTIGVKQLKPGEYEAEFLLRDEFGAELQARQTLAFKVVKERERESDRGGADVSK